MKTFLLLALVGTAHAATCRVAETCSAGGFLDAGEEGPGDGGWCTDYYDTEEEVEQKECTEETGPSCGWSITTYYKEENYDYTVSDHECYDESECDLVTTVSGTIYEKDDESAGACHVGTDCLETSEGSSDGWCVPGAVPTVSMACADGETCLTTSTLYSQEGYEYVQYTTMCAAPSWYETLYDTVTTTVKGCGDYDDVDQHLPDFEALLAGRVATTVAPTVAATTVVVSPASKLQVGASAFLVAGMAMIQMLL